MKAKFPMIARILLGLIFFIFGLNGFLQFIPAPPNLPEKAVAFFTGLMASGYFFPFLKGTEVICGVMLLTNMAAPVALIILAPIVLNIFLFHGILTPGAQNIILPVVMVVLQVVAMRGYWNLYRPLFGKK